MLTLEATKDAAFGQEWVECWNRRDLEALPSHYADDVEFRSLLAIRLVGNETGVVRGKDQLRAYFGTALAAFPGELDIKLLSVYRGVDGLVVQFESHGRHAAEVMELDGEGRVRRAAAHDKL